MPHFVTLIRYTQQGIAKIKESPSRLDAAKKAAETAGVVGSFTINARLSHHQLLQCRFHFGTQVGGFLGVRLIADQVGPARASENGAERFRLRQRRE